MFQMARSGRKSDSVMWLHFTKLLKEDGEEDFWKARCNHCEKVLSRGKADTPAGECSNGSMWSHMRNKQKTELEGARKEMETRKEARKQEVNLKDETVRGSLPGFQANNKAAFRKLVSASANQTNQPTKFKSNMSAIWFFSRHAVFRNFSTPKTRSCLGIKVQNLINLSSGTDYLSLPKLLTEIWPLKPHF